ncbi:LuxR C-terminal-related transcriptional regulator [Echinicola arenosa]|nr:LuxR C-terminal-related transcriptional regulator [Echinicola arenosa]
MLHLKLEELIKELKDRNILLKNSIDFDAFEQWCNLSDQLITLHDIGNYRPVFINNACKTFYGFENNFLKGMDYIYYLKTIHPSYYPTLFRSLTFFNEDKEKFLNLTYKLKDASGNWRLMVGITQTVTRSKTGKPLHAISIITPHENFSPETDAPILLLESLTKREMEVFMKLIEGLSANETAHALFISEETVKKHKKNIFKKLKCNKISELVAMAFELGVKY